MNPLVIGKLLSVFCDQSIIGKMNYTNQNYQASSSVIGKLLSMFGDQSIIDKAQGTPCRKGLNPEKNIQAYRLVAFERVLSPDQGNTHFIKIE